MLMERSLLGEDELYGDEPREHTALNWPPPMALPELPAACGTLGALPVALQTEEPMPELHFFARAARATRGPVLVLGTAVTVALSGGYAAGHAFGWKMPPKLRASVSPALTTFINQRIPALVARPGAPLWCPVEEEALPAAEARGGRRSGPGAVDRVVSAISPGQPAFFELATIDSPAISMVPRLRRPFQEGERPAPAWHGVVWSPRARSLVSLSVSGSGAIAASQGGGIATSAPMPIPFVH